MALPQWPDVPFKPRRDGFQPFKPMLDPIETEFEGGNTRSRSRPGDNVGTIVQTVRMTAEQAETFREWVKITLGNGTARFTAQVWMVTGFASRVCQFVGPRPSYTEVVNDVIDVAMQIKVYDV